MDIRVLQYFLAVAREESISRAAEALHMTQPPLSRQMRELEEELGTQLFVRGSRRIRLTEDGMLLRRRAGELIELMDKTRAELKNSDDDISGDIRIGAGETAAISLLARVAASLRQKFPHIRYIITSGDSELVLERLDKGLIDFGLLVGDVDVSRYEALTLPVKDTWGILMHRDSPLAQRERIRASDVRDEPLCLPRQATVRGELWDWLGARENELNITVQFNLIYNATHFVRHGLGYAFALDKLINTSGESELCFRPLDPPLEAPLQLAWKRDQLFSRACAAFLEAYRREWCGTGEG